MGPVTNDHEIGPSSAASASASGAADLSFSVGGDPQGAGFGDVLMVLGGGADGSGRSRATIEPDSVTRADDLAPVNESRSPEDSSIDMRTEAVDNSIFRSSKGEVVSSSFSAGGQRPAIGAQEISVFEGNRVSYDTGVSDLVRVQDRAIKDWMHGFQLGDLVWGKVKSHPWWPGYIYPEVFVDHSVRRTKRQGHVLVAFFGDSSYGWFEPAELIPFDPNYSEKSRQTAIRNFTKAVEEAVDETSRREALGLTCYCRNPTNFRPTSVPGHLSVDVPGFEPGVIYSLEQINRARDRFVPEKALFFAKEAALDKSTALFPGVERVKGVAVLLALRKARYEEFDETYAQAFGVQPVRPSPNTGTMPDERFAPRAAPLSGPQVYAEPQRPRKSSKPSSSTSSSSSSAAKAVKSAAAASSKKNKYVLKRREDPRGDDTRTIAAAAASSGLPMLSLPELHSSANPNVNFFQLASQSEAASPSSSPPTPVHRGGSSYSLQQQRPPPSFITAAQNPGYDDGEARTAPTSSVDFNFMKGVDVQNKPDSATMLGWGEKASADIIRDDETALGVSPAANVTAVPKKTKKMKRRLGDGTDGSVMAEEIDKRKKKKKKKQKMASIAEIGAPEHHLRTSVQPLSSASAAKAAVTAAEQRMEVAEASVPAIRVPRVDVSSLNLEFPLLVNHLKELALDPFYGLEDNVPAVAMDVFLKFRSLVYQKSLVLSPASEGDAHEVQARNQSATRAQPEVKTVGIDSAKALQEQRMVQPTLRQQKSIVKSQDPTKAGRKRIPSERQEELTAKRMKKLNKFKSLATTERKAAAPPDKTLDGQKESITVPAVSAAAHPAKPKAAEPPRKQDSTNVKTAESARKQDPPPPPQAAAARTPSPTSLFMKFPLRATLPSVMSLKAKFARFGPLEHEAIRVYWKTFTCKVVFKFKSDAQAALDHGKNNEMFGQVKVTYYIKDVESSDDLQKPRPVPSTSDGPHFRPGTGDGLLGPGGALGQVRPSASQLPRPPTGQLKSILKKPFDESGSNGSSSGRESTRVKFMLDTGGGNVEPPPLPVAMTASNNPRGNGDGASGNPKSATFIQATPSRPLSRPALSYSTEMFDDHRRLPPPPVFAAANSSSASFQPPSVPIPPPPSLAPEARNAGHVRLSDPRIQQQIQQTGVESKGKEVAGDFSERVMSLLLKCNDIVSNIKSTLGYLPLHPL